MHRCLSAFVMLLLSFFLSINFAKAYGPFSLPIHDNDVQINGGAWNYSLSCSAEQYETVYDISSSHGGFDFDGDEGDNVYAAASGTVSDVRSYSSFADCDSNTWGCYVDIDHDIDSDGTPDYTTKYAHLQEGSITVTWDDTVTVDTLIGQMGNTGNSNGAHLHFGIQIPGTPQYLDNSYWLDPYNLNDVNATCCDYPSGCPAEDSDDNPTNGNGHPDFDCDAATDSDYLWASCPPTYATTCTVANTYSVVLTQVDNNVQVITWEDAPSGNQLLSVYGPVANGPSGTVKQWFVGRITPDSWDDVLVSSTSGSTRTFWVYQATGDGGFFAPQSWKTRQESKVDLVLVGDTDGDDDLDLVIGDKNSTNQYEWIICANNGSSFSATCTAWNNNSQTNHRFGVQGDTFLLADMVDNDGRVELLRGWNPSACNSSNQKRWHRLLYTGTTALVASCWGHRSAQFLAGNVDTDTADELVTVRTTDDEVEVFVQGISEARANDVGGQDGWYYLYDFNADTRDDLIRWGSNGKVAWMANIGESNFQEQSQEGELIANLERNSNDSLLLGDYGEDEQVECSTTYPITTVSPWANMYANGSLLQYNGTVYWYSSGALRGIVSPDAFNSCGFNWAAITDITAEIFNSFPLGNVVDDPVDCGMLVEGDVFTGPTPGTVFWYAGGMKHGIVSPDAFNSCGFDWNAIEVYPWSTILIQIADGWVIDGPEDCW